MNSKKFSINSILNDDLPPKLDREEPQNNGIPIESLSQIERSISMETLSSTSDIVI